MMYLPTGPMLRRLIGLLAAGCLAGGLVTGCADAKKPKPASQAPKDARDAEWDAGLNRTPTPRTMLALARMLVVQGKSAQAEVVLERIVRQDSTFLPAYVELADLLLRQRRSGPAIDVLTAGLKVAPTDPVLQNDLGMAYLAERRYTQALAAFEGASAATPEDARYIANRALALGMLGRYDDALAAYGRILSPPEAHHNVALLCQARGDSGRAGRESSLAGGTATANAPAQSNAPSSVTIPPAQQGG